MKFGVREICNVVFRAKSDVTIGKTTFAAGQPVLYLDSAKTSTLEGAATTVYAQGGRGNTRLIAWEGEKTLTFTVEDALISPIGFSILSGAGLIQSETGDVHVHMTTMAQVSASGKIDLTDALPIYEGETLAKICKTAPIFVLKTDADGSLTGDVCTIAAEGIKDKEITLEGVEGGTNVMVDYYIVKKSANVSEIQIDAENFAGNYYVEAETLFRKQVDGVDAPVNITIPNVKIQSNFTFSMASTGDPSTFTFTMDAVPGYTYFDKTKKVLCVMQIIDDATGKKNQWKSVMEHTDDDEIVKNEQGENFEDSFPSE